MIIATNLAWRNFADANGADSALLSNLNYLEVCDRSAKLGSTDAATVARGIRAILDGTETDFEYEYPCNSKTESRWFQIRVTRFTGAGNVRLVVSHENITAIKNSQKEAASAFARLRESHQALEASEQQYRALADAMPQMVWSTLPCGTVDYFNQRWIEYTGCEANPDLVDGWLEILHPDDRERSRQCWHSALETGEPYSVEYRVYRASDGSYRWHLARGVPMRGPDGRITKWYGTTTDIDDQRRLNEELEIAKDAADAANRAKSEFLANMSHEIRTPMNGVLGMTELLLDTELSDEQRESLKLVKVSAESLMTIINDILDYSKIEAGHMELDPVEFQLHDLLQDTLKPLAHRAHGKGLEVTCDISADVPKNVVGDPNRLRQVIINLVGNAIKFTDSGEVILQASMVSQSEDDCEIAFAVIDTGIGIAKDKQIAIFDPFEQADTSTTRKYGGTGLGLTISSKLVALMGGKLAVSSKIGLGSKFFFQARFAQARLCKSPALDADLTKLAGLDVLIVDDNATNLRVLEEMLRQCRAVPRTATSGPEALEEFNQKLATGEPYQVVLVDAVMPEMDGFALVEQLCLNSPTTPPAIMMLTSADRQGDAARCRALGIASYLIKPIKAADLYHAISNCMDGLAFFGNIPTTTSKVSVPDSMNKLENVPSFKILLAEDNPVNQLVAVGILKNHGHQVTVANDGNEAISAYLSDHFDLVLMDVQMPVLDGLEATVKIRNLELTSGRHTPIIAMTSHAYKGDRLRCFDAGMDAYLSKPIVIPELLETIGRLAGSSQPDSQLQNQAEPKRDAVSESREPTSDQLSPVDFAALYSRVEHDLQLLDELIELFLETSPQMYLEIEAAVARRDRQAIEQGTHALKGAMLNIGAESAAEVAGQLELRSQVGSFEQLSESLTCLKNEMDRLVYALSSHQVSKQQ
jgi:PAS domain S-box-containing protein